MKEESQGTLQQNLRLCVASHRSEHRHKFTISSRKRRGKCVRGPTARSEDGRVARFKRKAEAAVVEVDLGVWLGEPAAKS